MKIISFRYFTSLVVAKMVSQVVIACRSGVVYSLPIIQFSTSTCEKDFRLRPFSSKTKENTDKFDDFVY